MIIEVHKNIYLKEIPLPNNPLRALNSYIIVSKDKNLIIDTGFNREECRTALMEGIAQLNLNFNNTYLLVTHLHADHSGLAAELTQEGIKVYAGEIDGEMMNQMRRQDYWDNLNRYKILFDLEKDNVSFTHHPGYKYCPKEAIDFIPLKEGDVLEIGDYNFEIVDIPGHTPGHIGLYERQHRLFFGGDHVLDNITPNIAFWGFDQDILSIYFESLKKVYELDVDYLFPAHRGIIRNHKKRIKELLLHHEERLEEIKSLIKEEYISARDVASRMEWDIRAKGWEDFPNPQKWFATGEAMSHLEHLVYIGEASKIEKGGILLYNLIDGRDICPICGKRNNCQRNEEECWCYNMEIPTYILELVPEDKKGKACICKACIEKYSK